jgi:hypothetical protein
MFIETELVNCARSFRSAMFFGYYAPKGAHCFLRGISINIERLAALTFERNRR